ncbi:methyltransferase domain-containing protein [Flavilitoribacter nigricans]|uniref:SAM-dependent methyltransferase n=1 Tax=Flavilitoribacter nigricans (strain ATCC 23147 / DSM 23189 / NBRC 102662 / NCIMB 1420 / SS-2) TaxID=1122177 RepID=A0A2D0NF36_FLAN2|nr:methyltransferase domain-containing protein [Flavilitoribacter nigricans]PHN07112.1 SAM-dependent methyltransferase [Flavilitoribacter nigricans DSM 23189 = NBRC 102662]
MPTGSLNDRIRKFYDESTNLWLDTWGEHMHHGHYGSDGLAKKDRRQAQIDLIEELLRWGGVESAERILDAGCGVGGSARYLAKRFDAQALGVTLSPVQGEAAARFNREAGLEDQVRIEVRDMMTLGPEDGPFDLIWSMESAEHIADKAGLMENFHRMLRPGGRLLMVTWCHRDLPPPLSTSEEKLLNKLYRIYNLPPMVAPAQLGELAGKAGFQQVTTDDWSQAVAPFWGAVIRSALEVRNFSLLMQTGWATIKGAWAMRYMNQGYRRGLIRFAVLKAVK